MVGMAQLASAPDCGSGGRGFESLYPPLIVSQSYGYSQAVRHRVLIPAFAGSNPASRVGNKLSRRNTWDTSSVGRAPDF